MKFIKNKFVSFILIISIIAISGGFPNMVIAESLLNAKDVMSTQMVSLPSDHTLTWTLASGKTNAAGGKVTIDFVEADYVASGTWAVGDFAFSDNVRTNQAPVGVGTIGSPATCTAGANNYTVNTTIATSTFQIVFCPSWTTSSTGTNTFLIEGTTGDGLLTNKASNVESSLITITNSVNDTDSTTIAAVVEDLDVVTVTATVNPTLTLEISSATVALNTITASTTGSGSHTAQVATNGSGGFLLTYNGITLTAPGGTIPAYGSKATSVAGTAGFGINMVDNATPNVGAALTQNAGTCAVPATGYETADRYSYVASTTTPLTAQTSAADCTYTISYVANVSSVTPAGSYSAPITYVASATF